MGAWRERRLLRICKGESEEGMGGGFREGGFGIGGVCCCEHPCHLFLQKIVFHKYVKRNNSSILIPK